MDQEDFGRFQACHSSPGVEQNDPNCAKALLDPDGDVDVTDTNLFRSCMSGPNNPGNPGCAGGGLGSNE
ncbi:MAG: hypothetical protein AMXMBFR13_10140 [Phycisphaerae bacterium]